MTLSEARLTRHVRHLKATRRKWCGYCQSLFTGRPALTTAGTACCCPDCRKEQEVIERFLRTKGGIAL